MTKLETGSENDNDKHKKPDKYIPEEALQAVLKFRDKSDLSDLSD